MRRCLLSGDRTGDYSWVVDEADMILEVGCNLDRV